MQERFLQVISGVLHSMEGRTTVLLTGHSMGGAIATLAANDLRRLLPRPSQVSISCYTFGAPRCGAHGCMLMPWNYMNQPPMSVSDSPFYAGNHSFALAFQQRVPDAWDVINVRLCAHS